MPGDSVDRGAQAASEGGGAAVGIDSGNDAARWGAGEGEAVLGDVDNAAGVGGDAGREVEVGGDGMHGQIWCGRERASKAARADHTKRWSAPRSSKAATTRPCLHPPAGRLTIGRRFPTCPTILWLAAKILRSSSTKAMVILPPGGCRCGGRRRIY